PGLALASSPFRSAAVDSSPESRPKEENDRDSDRHGERGGGSLCWRCEGRLGVDVVLLGGWNPWRRSDFSAVLEKKKAIDEIIKKASSVKDHLVSFPPFCHYERNGK
ncbi:hypothetical protein BHM03_00018466, partial [Ensete ventricosum]